ncbi:MAG TPA: type II CAAX endopeptidase family protein [Candidatus Synoicihabitans sp.]|nr:type II CAAX endopeptidase family protein [Candidatus Synoicihabitans sp.]
MPDEITPAMAAAITAQGALVLLGLIVLWRCQFSARADRSFRLPRWDLDVYPFLILCAIVMVTGLIGQVVLLAFVQALAGPLSEDLQLVAAGGAFQAGLLTGVLVAVAIVRRLGDAPLTRASTEAPVRPARPLLVASGATFVVALPILLLCNLPWLYLLEKFGLSADRQELVDLFARAESPALVVVIMLFAIVVAPVTEELIFRAGLFRYLRTRVARPLAFGIPAVIFASLHGNLAAFVPLVVLGLIFAIAYERTGRIAVPMIAHGLFNLNTILLLLSGVST